MVGNLGQSQLRLTGEPGRVCPARRLATCDNIPLIAPNTVNVACRAISREIKVFHFHSWRRSRVFRIGTKYCVLLDFFFGEALEYVAGLKEK